MIRVSCATRCQKATPPRPIFLLMRCSVVEAIDHVVDLMITPVNDGSVEGDETVIFTLDDRAGYNLGAHTLR